MPWRGRGRVFSRVVGKNAGYSAGCSAGFSSKVFKERSGRLIWQTIDRVSGRAFGSGMHLVSGENW